jgi:ubiquitin-protein ligase
MAAIRRLQREITCLNQDPRVHVSTIDDDMYNIQCVFCEDDISITLRFIATREYPFKPPRVFLEACDLDDSKISYIQPKLEPTTPESETKNELCCCGFNDNWHPSLTFEKITIMFFEWLVKSQTHQDKRCFNCDFEVPKARTKSAANYAKMCNEGEL